MVAVAVSLDHYPTDSQLQVYDIYIIRRVLLAARSGREHLDLDLAQVRRASSWNK